jgi:hypothetical protein
VSVAFGEIISRLAAQSAHERRGAADRGEYRQAAGATRLLGGESRPAKLRGHPTIIPPLAAQSSPSIITMAKGDERDAKWLADSAILYLSQQRLTHTAPDAL